MSKMSKKIIFYTDGACNPNPGKGSWAFVRVLNDEMIAHEVGSEENVTNNRMELMAIYRAIVSTPEGSSLEIISDSQYCVNIYSKWYITWLQKNKFSGKSNIELIHQTWDAIQKRDVTFSWVKGHDGNRFNEIADELCGSLVF